MQATPIGSQRPIFIVGAPRSGTTMLRYMLSAHPRIYIPPESNFMTRLLPLPPDAPLSREQAVELFTAVRTYKVFFRDWHGAKPDAAAFVDALPDRKPATLLHCLYAQYAQQHGAVRWGDKSPIYTSHVAELARLFPTAQFVHIVRDGRDVALSMLNAYQGRRFFYVDLCFATRSWQRRVRSARRAGQALGQDRYLELRYEQLTAVADPTLHTVCDFLGEPFDPAMLHPDRMADRQYHSKGVHAATRRPPNTRSVGRWRTEMSPADQRLFEAMAGDFLAELGYERTNPGRSTAREQMRLAGLQAKFTAVDTSRRLLQSAGIFHPASLLATLSKWWR